MSAVRLRKNMGERCYFVPVQLEGRKGACTEKKGPARCSRHTDVCKQTESTSTAAAQQATPSSKITYINQADIVTFK